MGIYSPLVDLMGNYQIGTKTVLYLLDALICAPSEGASITKANSTWQQAPFNGDYTSSIFLSQDPVAIDSVGADFLMNEPTVTENNSSLRGNPNVENYLHEAGLVKGAPSGNIYYDGNGGRLSNLGVHEHWNNAQEKKYGRNLGREEGIELVPLTSEQGTEDAGEKQKILVAYFSCTNTTGTLAKYTAEGLGADLYEIMPRVPYTEEDLAYYTGGRADQEQNDPDARPEISGSVKNMEEYDTIVLGYPIWHGQAPRIISTFLESYDFSGKTKDGQITEKCTVCGKDGNKKTIAAVKSIRLSKTSYTYNGKMRKPSVTVTDREGKRLKEGADYTVSYPASSKNAGIYTIKVQFRGNYSGIEKTSFQITPKGTAIAGVSAKKKGFTVKWKKQKKQTDGYEIVFSTSSKFPKKKTEIINIKGNVKASKTVSKLKAKKKYYIRIRTYKAVKAEGGQNKIYSGWSKPKTVKTKK